MTLSRRTPTGRELRLVTDEPTLLEREVARIRAERAERHYRNAEIAAAVVYTMTRKPRWAWLRRNR